MQVGNDKDASTSLIAFYFFKKFPRQRLLAIYAATTTAFNSYYYNDSRENFYNNGVCQQRAVFSTILFHALYLRRSKQPVNQFIITVIALLALMNFHSGNLADATINYRTIVDSGMLSNTISSDQFVNSRGVGKNGNEKARRCEPITIPLCQKIGYNMTSFPNAYGHERQEEAGLEVHQFYPLVEVNCYKHLKFFLCSMYTPICQDNYELSVMPCREVCLEARKNCAPLMQKYGFRWPATLECDERLPKISEQERTGRICAAPPDTVDPETATNAPNEADNGDKQPNISFESDNRAVSRDSNALDDRNVPPTRSSAAIGAINVVGGEARRSFGKCDCRCTRPFQALTGVRLAIERADVTYTVQNISNCAYACHSPAIYAPEDQAFLNTWIAIWSGICMTLSLFTVLTFLTDVGRFPYPERPIFFLSLCQLMVALGFMLRVVYSHERVACDGGTLLKIWSNVLKMISFASITPMTPAIPATAADNGDPLCLLVFVLIYFFGMCASAWWVVLSLSWVLAAVPHWSTEWIAKYSAYFHLFAWLTPALQTLLVLAFGAVDGDPMVGICYVGNTNVFNLRVFVLGPLMVYFFVGVSFLSIGFLNLWGIRSNLKKTHPGVDKTSKLTQLMSKIGIFSVLYTVPAIFLILVLFYEQHYRNVWEQAQLCPCASQIENQNGTLLLLTLVKSASMLVVGWTSGVWIFSAKTLQSWRRVFGCVSCTSDCATGCCDHETRRRRRQGYVPAVNRLSGGGGAILDGTDGGGTHNLLHDEITPIHQQYQSSTLPYSVAAERSLNRPYTSHHSHHHLILNGNNNNKNNSRFHVYHHSAQPPPAVRGYTNGGAENGCMSPLTYATASVANGGGTTSAQRHSAMPENV